MIDDVVYGNTKIARNPAIVARWKGPGNPTGLFNESVMRVGTKGMYESTTSTNGPFVILSRPGKPLMESVGTDAYQVKASAILINDAWFNSPFERNNPISK
jgi:hypothetical protein